MNYRLFVAAIGTVLLVCPSGPAFAKRVEECEVERIDYSRSDHCGVEAYSEKRTEACGAEAYNLGEALACAGSEGKDYVDVCAEWSVSSGDIIGLALPTCARENPAPRGFKKVFVHSNNGWGPDPMPHQVWLRPGRSVACRKPEFGVEKWKSCRHPTHDVELRLACVPETIYKDCEILKTRVELDAFLYEIERSLPITESLYLTNRVLLAKLMSNDKALACTIAKWDGDPLHADLLDQFKRDFLELSGRVYLPTTCAEFYEADMLVPCLGGPPEDGICNAHAVVEEAKTYFRERLAETTALLNDVVPRKHREYAVRLEALRARLEQVNK